MFNYNEQSLEFDGRVWHQLEYANIVTNHGELLYGEIFQLNPSYLLLLNSNDDFRNIQYTEIAKMY